MLHPSRMLSLYMILYLVLVAVFFIFGIGELDFVFLLPVLIILIFFFRIKSIRYIFLTLFVVVMSWRGVGRSLAQVNLGDTGAAHSGYVLLEPNMSDRTQSLIIKLETGEILSTFVPAFPEYSIGDRVYIEGGYVPATEDEYYKNNPSYFYKNQIGLTAPKSEVSKIGKVEGLRGRWFHFRNMLIDIKDSYIEVLDGVLPRPENGLAAGILLGEKAGLPEDLLELFVLTGLIHIIALSGYNVTIIADNLEGLTKKVSSRFSFWFSVTGVWAFVVATGLSASIVRAAIMGTIFLVAKRVGRQSDALAAILLAATIMVVLNPAILLYDIGFQLSFLAMLGIIYLTPIFSRPLKFLPNVLSENLSATLGAQAFTMPLICYYFGKLSLVSPISNILVLPFMPLIMILVFITGTVGFLSLWLAARIGIILNVLLGYVINVTEVTAGIPWANKELRLGLMGLFGVYLVLLELIFIFKKKGDFEKRKSTSPSNM